MTPLIGFAPDADPVTPGIFVDCQNIIPTNSGFAGALSPVPAVLAPLADECRGAAVGMKLDGTRRVFAGTQTRLYELAASAWIDQSKSGGYVGSADSRWSFCQFGDTTIASNLTDPMQSSNAAAFADIAGAPKAKIVVSASNNFVLAFHTNDPDYGPSPDRWWNCAQNDQTDWVPNVSTSANTGRLVAVGGPITAAKALGDYVIAYKAKGIFLGSFVGAPVVWQWNMVPGSEAGAVGPEGVCDIGIAHFIVGEDDFWIFDGTRPASVGHDVVRTWFAKNGNPIYRDRTKVSYDRQLDVVYIDYPSVDSDGDCDARLVYHVASKRWGRADVSSQAPLNFITPGVTIDGLDAYGATIDALPNAPLDSNYWSTGSRMSAYFDATNTLVSSKGATGDSSFTTGDLGDDDTVSMLDAVRVRYTRRPTTARAVGYAKFNEGDDMVEVAACDLNDGKFDLRQSGRFHRIRVDMTGSHAETGIKANPKMVGGR